MPPTKRKTPPRPGRTRANQGQPRAGAVIKMATENFFGTGRVAKLDECLEVLTALMRGEFYHWGDLLAGLQPGSRVNAILEATTKLVKVHGGFQKPSENERDREWKATQWLAAAFGIRNERLEQGKPIDPESIWTEMLEWAKLKDQESDLAPFEREILASLAKDNERQGYVH